jgi:Raf kinase inhibitor-like YbhB/YbcL family protein
MVLLLTACATVEPAAPTETAVDSVPTATLEPAAYPYPGAYPAPAESAVTPAPVDSYPYPNPTAGQALSLTSPAFAAGASIPKKYTCQGEDLSPQLEWSGVPAGTQSLALIVDDPDAPGGTWVHWVVYNLPADASGLAEGASQANAKGYNLPAGGVQGGTSFNRADYGGPCPPSGEHRYFFKLYALDIPLPDQGLNKEALLEAMDGHILAQAELVGLYQK